MADLKHTRVVVEVIENTGDDKGTTRMVLDLMLPVSMGEAGTMAARLAAEMVTHAHAAAAASLVGLPLEPTWKGDPVTRDGDTSALTAPGSGGKGAHR